MLKRRLRPATRALVSGAISSRVMRGLVAALLLELVAASHSVAGWNQWTTMGPGGGNLALAIDPVTPRTLYAARNVPGPEVFKSADGGAHWALSTTGLTAPFVSALAVDGQTPTTVYAGVSGADVWGAFKSTDGGANWSPSHAGFPPIVIGESSIPLPIVTTLVVDPQNHATVYAGTSVGVFKSTNAGASWNVHNTGLLDLFVTALTVDPKTPNTLYTATPAGVFKSADGGVHWILSDVGLPHLFFGAQPQPSVSSLTVDPHDPATVYAGTIQGVFKSTDGGESWSFSMNGVTFIGSHVSAVAVDPQMPGTLYAATFGAGVFKSTDGAQTWTPFSVGLYPLVTGLQISPSGACLHAAGWIGVFSLVTRPDPCASPLNAFVGVNETSFQAGQTLTASVGLLNLEGQGPADVYLGIVLPDSNFPVAFFTSADSFEFGTLEDFTSYRPVATGVPLASAFATTVPDFFTYRLTGAEPRGDYAFIFYAVRAGAAADGVLAPDEVLAFAWTPFTFFENPAESSAPQ